MENSGALFLLFSLFGLILLYAIIYYAVLNANAYNNRMGRIQADLLAKIAKKQGVDGQEISDSMSLK